MKKVLPVVAIILILLAYFAIRGAHTASESTSLEPKESELVSPPGGYIQAAETVVRRPNVRSNKVKELVSAPRPNSLDTQEILDRSSRKTLELAKVTSAQQVNENEPSKVSEKENVFADRSRRVRASFAKGETLPQASCNNEACQNSQDGYMVAGIVINADRPSSRKHLIDGDVGIGDAKRRPLLHIK